MFNWSEKYSVGVIELDNQHKKLFEIGKSIVNTYNSDSIDKYDEIMHLLSELHNYTVYHFETEEKILKENNVVFSDEHKNKHEDFIYRLLDLKSLDIDNSQDEVLINTLDFVSTWITDHILRTDMEYKGLL